MWVDRYDATRFREYPPASAIRATFSDTRAPGHLEYTDVTTQFDTRNVLHVLTYRNAEIGPDGNEQTFEGEIHDQPAIDIYGTREASLELNLNVPRWWGNLHHDPNGLNEKASDQTLSCVNSIDLESVPLGGTCTTSG
ncbi:hypothetical protein MTE01_25840 [Microbacterium testaceum]|uniref:Uncharacterized protein n=1 Tax=Microbacterium testaceum TaxID=2033 RepID=A0A4Y3QNV1_MICTE|nr:hypothetical protein MTE01_25840 [Microbacterium testaceum]